MEESNIMSTSTSDVLATVDSANMQTWSDPKRKEFSDTFEKRTRSAQYILVKSAGYIITTARHRYFIGEELAQKLAEELPSPQSYRDPIQPGTDGYSYTRYLDSSGGRSLTELDDISLKRAQNIIDELPPAKKAVAIIQPDIARKMDEKDRLQKKGSALKTKLDKLSEFGMEDCPDSMTLGAFRKKAKDNYRARKHLVDRLNETGREGNKLQQDIDKALYKGLPGLDQAVAEVVRNHIERARMMDQLCRRVQEKVMFGDSEAAMELLKHFEKDEIELSDTIKEQFAAALAKLRVSRKQLKGKQ